MGRLVEINECEECPFYRLKGHQFRWVNVEDRWGNTVQLNPDEYIGFCKHWDQIIFDEDIKNGIAVWCHLPTREYLEHMEEKLRAQWLAEEAKKFNAAMDTIGRSTL